MTIESLALEGIRVLELGQLIAVPSAAQQLAEYGADVIKIEPPGGEPTRKIKAAYATAILRGYNRGKRSVEIDLKNKEDFAFFERLIVSADILLHNMRPGTLARIGLPYDRLETLRPQIISVSVSGFGSKGPSAVRAGLDIAAQAESGLMSVTGEASGDPQRVGAPIIDHATSYVVTQAVLAAVIRRDRHGVGSDIRVPLLDVAVHLQTPNWVEHQLSDRKMTRNGNGQPSVAPAADVITVHDGQLVISGYQPHAWNRLCEVIDRPDLVDDPRFVDNDSRVHNRADLLAILTQAIGHMSTQGAVDKLVASGIVAAMVRTYDEVLAAPDVIENGVFVDGRTETGSTFKVPAPPFRSHPPLSCDLGAIPEVGEHTREIRDAVLRPSHPTTATTC
ncbi:CoA transferase [Rhodococcus sp. IEGM 1318]|uniref:CaiB/BaiF CoA transferase family protein n=1 Tax=Rhodococcus sp. IEGM 1318 TaxID=3082226 RepID=UPI002953DADA|nr:CoA transferase [Rhodococcus sp. IEGM 1318]MDV8009375.1 CoA transferase [Rhodococcus sp. IEGM 1318]